MSTPKPFRAVFWPRPPACLTAAQLDRPPNGARIAVCGLVIVRQRPGSAKGVLFVTLEDETGVVNVVVWAKVYEAHRRAVIAGRLLRVTGRVQREGSIVHVLAERVEDVSSLLDALAAGVSFDAPLAPEAFSARADAARRPRPDDAHPAGSEAGSPDRDPAHGLPAATAPRATHPRAQAKLLFRRLPASA